MEHGWNYISLFVFSLILILANAASVHSANTRRQLVAAIEPNTVLVEHHDQGYLAPAIPFLKPFTATTAPATTATETNKIEAVYLPPSSFPPEASCMMAIWSLIVDIPTPGPALSAALHQAKDTLAPSAMASPQCTITLPATLSSEYGVYTSRVSSWVSKHSEELDTLDSVCAETSRDMRTGPGCTAPVAVFTGASSVGATSTGATSTGATSTGATSTGTSTAAGGGSGGGSSTAKATGSSTGVMTSTKTGTGMTTTTTTMATVTSSVTTSLTGSATTVAGATSSQSVSGPQQAGGAARVTGVMVAAMVVAAILAVVVAL
ncbi:hypothetical protein NEUTE1DRAFT_109194 [Neurospora tetrasperma FGSC 2508]|uniref:Infection structure specific protein n=1 Tax=Neurospora tetrasperma (strain FGSC 2508 / ATCC MYA-4615 / P0657) TaxID=510951 RepID=F8MI05_NEUT8|nr:uncharacterized protein NEUTE1DRAFT_109194 [Neurospora tetrasperma FGSC 2508]EGO59713.1 hypothetical protein NEUTE1DRAFT_109194 [Neurospora tetrasperma FGSC 2508]EGZ73852.1 hypothetical protein NEUTE2DRAFT_138121 [Neurospora tetrasperma FGSC 2509]